MNAQDCLNLLRTIKDVSFATVDRDGRPKNRVIDVMLVEHERLYFCTARGKDFYRELMENGNVAIAGLDKDTWQTIRLSGKAERLSNQKEWIDRIFLENPSMNGVYPGESRYILEAFCVSAGIVEWFDLSQTPIRRAYFSFGGKAVREPGFRISDRCVGCGTCAANCPQKCIQEGTPFVIAQSNCLHCGLCAENCPVAAIERLGD